MHDLRRSLIDYDMAMLRAVAHRHGITLGTNRHSEAVTELADALLDPLRVRVARAQLSQAAKEALAVLVARGGRMRAEHFSRMYGHVRPFGPGKLERESPWAEPANVAEELWYSGQVFRGFSQEKGRSSEYIYLPNDFLPGNIVAKQELQVEQVPYHGFQAGEKDSFVQDLFSYLVYLLNHDVRTHADGRLAKRDLQAIASGQRVLDPQRLSLVQHLSERLNLVQPDGKLLRLNSGNVRQWLSASPEGRLELLQQAWRNDPDWSDLCLVPGLSCEQSADWRPPNDPIATRQAILAQLARCPVDGWWTLQSFIAGVKDADPDFQRRDGDYDSWFIRGTDGAFLSGYESWDHVEGALLAHLLTATLQWLGIVNTAKVRLTRDSDSQMLCGLTASGARLLQLAAPEQSNSEIPPIQIRPDMVVEVLEPVSLYNRFQMERFAERQSLKPCRYRLTAPALSRGLSRGIEVEQILAFLRQASGEPVPVNVAGQLRLWAGRLGQVELQEVVLLQVKGEHVLKELSYLPETRHLILRVITPTSALVRSEELPRLRKVLRELGYLPPESEGGESSKRG